MEPARAIHIRGVRELQLVLITHGLQTLHEPSRGRLHKTAGRHTKRQASVNGLSVDGGVIAALHHELSIRSSSVTNRGSGTKNNESERSVC